MKSVIRFCAVAVAMAVLSLSAVAADDCCKKTAKSVKDAKGCEKCAVKK